MQTISGIQETYAYLYNNYKNTTLCFTLYTL
jgi:hypothetical protein